MGEREELNSQHSKLTVRKHELNQKLEELEGTAEHITGLKEPPRIIVTSEKIAEIENIRREIDEINSEQKKVIEKIQQLPRE